MPGQQPQELPTVTLDVYERTFLMTVLRLRGIEGRPSLEAFREALRIYEQYGLEVAKASDRGDPIDEEWLEGRPPEHAATEHAFLFIRFQSVLVPSAAQLEALNEWLSTGHIH